MSALASEVCRDNPPASWNVGVYADFRGNISATQSAIGNWVQGKCLTGYDSKDAGEQVPITFIRRTSVPQETQILSGLEQISEPISATAKRQVRSQLHPRDTCKYLKVESGDSCYSLAQECGISQTQFTGFNSKTNFCNTLKPDQYVCCSKGDLPDCKYSKFPFLCEKIN